MDFRVSVINIIFFATFILQIKAENDCDVTINQGKMHGMNMKTKKQKPFCAFLGIPFALPPIGELRFKPPLKANPWNGTLPAIHDGKICMQPSYLTMEITGDEDCLYLNVYTPKIMASNGSLLDVLVWIHPGAFYAGSDSSLVFEPNSWMNMDIVLVTINYRLGAFGFLSTGDDEAPGNYGLKDQVLALQWVQDNVEAFGGDPRRVTISGHSAGSASTHYHMFSPLSQGLFQRVISMEGTALNPFARDQNPKSLATRQARYLGCPEDSSSAIVSCLQKQPARKFSESINKLFLFWLITTPGFTPVVEKKTNRNPEPFLTEDPYDLMLSGNFLKVPWLMGGNDNPMGLYFAPFMNVPVLRDQINQQLKTLLPGFLLLEKSTPPNQFQTVVDKIVKLYDIDTNEIQPGKEMNWMKLFSDRHFIHGIHRTAILHSLAGHQSIYKYNYAYRGLFSVTVVHTLKNYGVSHGDELIYFFRESLMSSTYDLEVKELLLTLWTNFIKYGNPTPNTTESSSLLGNIIWHPIGELEHDDMHVKYLNIGQIALSSEPSLYFNEHLGPFKLNMAKDIKKDRMEFWDALPLYENAQCGGCMVESSGNHVKVSIFLIIMCICLWNSVNKLFLYK